jgi:hypothetical protein
MTKEEIVMLTEKDITDYKSHSGENQTDFIISAENYADYCATKIAHLSIIKQQRLLKKLAISVNKKAQGQNAVSNPLFDRLTWQRKIKLSRESRIHHLICAYLKGIPYSKVEHKLNHNTIDPLTLVLYYASHALTETIQMSDFLNWAGYDKYETLNY